MVSCGGFLDGIFGALLEVQRSYSRSERRPKAELYGFTMRSAIPSFPLPLKLPSEVAMVELQSIVQGVYDRGGYAVRIDYQQVLPGLSN